MILGARNVFKNENGAVHQRSNAERYWTRDFWITESTWSSDDFIVHCWKERWGYKRWDYLLDFSTRNGSNANSRWFSPFISEEFDLKRCNNISEAHFIWLYRRSLIRPTDEIRKRLQSAFRASFEEHLKRELAVVTS
jgi:hypothetical protein